jgi:hypothetical protein
MPDYGDRIVVTGKKDTRLIPLAELLLPDDRLPDSRMFVVRSEWFGGEYESLAAIIKKRAAVEGRMNNEMLDWQRAIAAPCFVQYGILGPDQSRLYVFGEIPDIETCVADEAWFRIGAERAKFARRLQARLESAGRRGWLYGKWYSVNKPQGEHGCQHRNNIQEVLDESTFTQIKLNGWKR